MGNLLRAISSNSILGLIENIIDGLITAILGPIIWGLCDIFFLILDMFDTLYKKFAGIDDMVINGETVMGQDPVLYMINTDIVQEMFFSIVTLSVILLIIFTIFAIVKNVYAEKPKPIGEILRSMTKALLMYLLVPIATVVCLLVGNVVLRAIDGATKLGGAGGMSDMLFLSAAYSANRFRDDDTSYALKELKSKVSSGDLSPNDLGDDQNHARVNNYIKIMEENGIDVKDCEIDDPSKIDLEEVASAVDEAYVTGIIGGSKWRLFQVTQFYYVTKINLITVWAGGAFMIFALGKITWGLVSRLFKMTAYFAISPALMAMFPIKGDTVLKSWTGEMVKNATMAYCAVGVLNVVLSILPAFSQLKLFSNSFLNGLATLFVDIVAIASAEKMISTVSGWFGTGDALAEGKAAQSDAKKTKDALGKGAKKASGVFAGMVGGAKAAKGALDPSASKGDKFKAGLSGMFGGAMSQTGFAKMRQDTQKNWQDAKKGGEDYYKNTKTKTWTGEDKGAFERDENGKKIRGGHRGGWINPRNLIAHRQDLEEGGMSAAADFETRTEFNKDVKKRRASFDKDLKTLLGKDQVTDSDVNLSNPDIVALLDKHGFTADGGRINSKGKKEIDEMKANIAHFDGVSQAQETLTDAQTKSDNFQRSFMGTRLSDLEGEAGEQFIRKLTQALSMGDTNKILELGVDAENSGYTETAKAINQALGNTLNSSEWTKEFKANTDEVASAEKAFVKASEDLTKKLEEMPQAMAFGINHGLTNSAGALTSDFASKLNDVINGELATKIEQFKNNSLTAGKNVATGNQSEKDMVDLLKELLKEAKKK